ncbi:MAG: fatty acid desaturase family protein [Dongiaceae bacterium]
MRVKRDYSLIGPDSRKAVENGLATGDWYRSDIPRKQMKELMRRSDGPAIRDTILWIALFVLFGYGGLYFWGTWWCVPFFVCYGVLYGSSTDSRWHECGHGTAFKTRWMRDLVYQIASFMIMREPTIWRWSHTRHHTNAIIVGRDPVIVATRPPKLFEIFLYFFGVTTVPKAVQKLLIHATGRLTEEEKTFVPEIEWHKVYRVARIWLVIHASAIGLAIHLGSWLPLMYVGVLPTMYGAWLAVYFGLTQHVGLAEDVLDHRLNSRTVYMNPVFRFVYWNMNYHVEHHIFPMVPYHALPKLHAIMMPDMPKPCASTIEAYREIIPALIRQLKEPDWTVRRELPASAKPYQPDLRGNAAPAAAE